MKLFIEKSDLIALISTAQKALSSRSPSPILECIYLEAKEGSLKVVCNDSTLQIETCAAADVQLAGCAAVPGRFFGDIVRKLPEGTIDLELKEKDENKVLYIKCGKSKTNIQCMNADEYPLMQMPEEQPSLKIKQGLLKDMIRQTVFATSLDEARPILMGCLFEGQEDQLNVVGLDGYRLAVRREACPVAAPFKAVIPATALNEINKIIGDDETEVSVTFSRNNVLFDLKNTRINAVMLSGEFMKYASIIPKEHQSLLRINRKELLDAIDRASLMAREGKSNLVRFNVNYDQLVITSNSELGNVYEEVSASLTGAELEIAFNSKYMTDVLRSLDDEEVLLHFNNNITPCVIEPTQGSRFLYLVLPVRIFVR
jgi:DNA polymerase-3 subunit beta